MIRFLFVAILAVPVSPQAATIDLVGTPAHVRESNPELKAARLAVEEARGRLLASGRLSNPSLSFEFQGESGLSPRTTGLAVDQRFPLTKRLQLERNLSTRMVDAAELEVRDTERKLIAEAQSLVVRLLALQQQRVLRERQTALAKELADFARDRSAKGEISPLDAAQALVDFQQALLGERTLRTGRVVLLGDLKRTLGVPAGEELIVVGELPPLAMPPDDGWEQRPDFQHARLKEAAARTSIDLAKARKWEDVTAGLVAATESQGMSGAGRDHSDFVGFRFSLPLPFWNQNEGEVAEKAAGAQRASLETEALASDISNEAAAARDEMAAHASLATEMRGTLLPAIREQTERLGNAYQLGEVDLLAVLRSREQWLELEAAALDAARDFHLARVRHEAAIALHAPASPGRK